MHVEIALPDIDADDLPPFVIARIADKRSCPVLARPLQQAISRLIAGMNVVLVHRDVSGDLRLYGDERLVAALPGIDLDCQCWASFEMTGHLADDLDVAA